MYIILLKADDKYICQKVNKSCQNDIIVCQIVKGGKSVPLVNHLKEYRARIGVNQQNMGKLAGVSRQTISLIERGDYSPSVTLALKLAGIFGVKVEDLFEYVEENDE